MSTEKLRYIEYYNMQDTFDNLYQRSKYGQMKGVNLLEIIQSENNILLAYRMIKKNTGSKTKGTDNQTIEAFKILDKDDFIKMIRHEIENYKPLSIRRVTIPKSNGQKRALGIPTMKDRLIQQMFLQVLEPICEAKFYQHSYGFRSGRSTQHAIARCNRLMYTSKCHFVVDVDIKGFFDNVNHTHLLKQLYTIGVKDKRVLTIVSKMLKAPIKGYGIPNCGTPQGGILSPLLSNVVLNQLDWWIANQFETFETRYPYKKVCTKHVQLRKTKLKEMHIVRYADDFKIFTTSSKSAWKIFHAVKAYLKNNLKLEVSPEKSKVTNLRRRYTEFVGFELKVNKHRNEYVSISRISQKQKERITKEVKRLILTIQKNPTTESVIKYNTYVLGIQNYFKIATRVSVDLKFIHYSCYYTLFNRLKRAARYGFPRSPPELYKRLYSQTMRTFKVDKIYLFPLQNIKWELARTHNSKATDYTEIGRLMVIKKLWPTVYSEIVKMTLDKCKVDNLEYFDNRISRYSMQRGKCHILGKFLTHEEVHCHHKLPIHLGGDDSYSNLVILHKWVHILVHTKQQETINKYLNIVKLNEKQFMKLNRFRKLCNLTELTR